MNYHFRGWGSLYILWWMWDQQHLPFPMLLSPSIDEIHTLSEWLNRGIYKNIVTKRPQKMWIDGPKPGYIRIQHNCRFSCGYKSRLLSLSSHFPTFPLSPRAVHIVVKGNVLLFAPLSISGWKFQFNILYKLTNLPRLLHAPHPQQFLLQQHPQLTRGPCPRQPILISCSENFIMKTTCVLLAVLAICESWKWWCVVQRPSKGACFMRNLHSVTPSNLRPCKISAFCIRIDFDGVLLQSPCRLIAGAASAQAKYFTKLSGLDWSALSKKEAEDMVSCSLDWSRTFQS